MHAPLHIYTHTRMNMNIYNIYPHSTHTTIYMNIYNIYINMNIYNNMISYSYYIYSYSTLLTPPIYIWWCG